MHLPSLYPFASGADHSLFVLYDRHGQCGQLLTSLLPYALPTECTHYTHLARSTRATHGARAHRTQHILLSPSIEPHGHGVVVHYASRFTRRPTVRQSGQLARPPRYGRPCASSAYRRLRSRRTNRPQIVAITFLRNANNRS